MSSAATVEERGESFVVGKLWVVVEMALDAFLEFWVCPRVDDLKSACKANEVLLPGVRAQGATKNSGIGCLDDALVTSSHFQ